MAVILQFASISNPVTQAHLERDDTPWWSKIPQAFQQREHADSIARPCEDAALRNVEAQARAWRHVDKHVGWLSPSERELLATERECLRRNVALVNPFDQSSWIAAQMGGEWNARGVRAALADISQILVDAENERVTEVLVKWGRRKIARRQAAWAADTEKAA